MINHMYTWIERIWRFQASVEAVSDVTSLDPKQSSINQQHQGRGHLQLQGAVQVQVSWPVVSGHHHFLVSK